MKGLELSRKYYEQFGKPMLEESFGHLTEYIAVGFVGRGSERFGFDDDISTDHDFEPGFCIFIPGEEVVSRRDAFLLERAYAALPKEFEGVRRLPMSPVGGNRNGVLRTNEFYLSLAGTENGILTAEQWLAIPQYALAEATDGEVFFDGYGEFSQIRSALLNMPEDVRLKRLAGNLLIMGQSGQYNFSRCIRHGEPEAAALACNEFVNSALEAVFLLKKKYMPYYKWSFRALRQIDGAENIASLLSSVLLSRNAEEKAELIEKAAGKIIRMLKEQKITDADGCDLERHAYSVNDKITDSEIRNMNILVSV